MMSKSGFVRWRLVFSLGVASALSTFGGNAFAEDPKPKPAKAVKAKSARAVQAKSAQAKSVQAKDTAKEARRRSRSKRKKSTLKERRANRKKTKEGRAKKRRERLESAATSLRSRAADLRTRAKNKDIPPTSKRPGAVAQSSASLLRKADELEEKAKTLDVRSKSAAGPRILGAGNHGLKHKARVEATRKARKKFLRRRWGKKLHNAQATEELRLHARRIAKLKRIRSLAQRAKQFETAKRATGLLVREQARHQKSMMTIQPPTAAEPQ